MKPNKPANTPDTGPIRCTRSQTRKGNPTKKGKIFGNPHNCSATSKNAGK